MTEHQNLVFNTLDKKAQAVLSELKASSKQVFVTGAGGFLGKALCQFLRSADIKVIGFARGDYPELSALGVTMVKGDISDQQTLFDAMAHCDVVFHVASKAGVWGNKESYFKPNVEGTDNIINACIAHNITRLIYTSTPSVTFCGKDEINIDESSPYAAQFLNFYGLSKAVAEQKVLNSNSDSLKTVALRPHLIWGPGDRHLVPRVLARAKANKLKLVGKNDKLVDTIYIDNAVYAHLLAAVELNKQDAKCAGKAYFLSNDEPIFMADMLNKILACQNLPAVTKRVPAALAYTVGTLLEWVYLALRKKDEPIMTRFVAKQLSTAHYFNINAAKQDLNYTPLINIEQGMHRLKISLN
ncbi:2-alkyl-3-oxoalkanoate reductase [Psychromonas sp. Urea-02u-13]|uniref:2-alkyl-3-oxoalkanoate reductase n=1 Tax=Psychromonas sp. Urea-02u-13 TaxID=2058326 RepID=UPI000C33ADF1|nr:2-alkyl-3-oxoalkanoate reductase [Psychromonas sp. Urea-02u-13]PKG39578.1 3-beta hydroxysteroid dehydrogenase [Psychromonas sp. Urea-02u-13]